MAQQQFSLAQLFLWLFVIVLGIELGAGLYETLVVLPLWSQSPPESVIAYYNHNKEFPQFALNAGGRFWMVNTPLTGLTALAALISGFGTQPAHRKWRIIASVLALIVVIWTFAWFVPNIMLLYFHATEVSGEQLAGVANWWVRLNWIRVVIYSAAWLAALYTMTIPPRKTTEL
jgi:hypothetical protein